MHAANRQEDIGVVMLVASLPPLAAGGAEMQALKLAQQLHQKGIRVSFITPGKGTVNGRSSINGIPVYYLYSFPARVFNYLSNLKKKKKARTVRLEYPEDETTNQIVGKVGLPTVVYYSIFFWHSLFFLWKRKKSFTIIHAHTMEWSAIVAARLGRVLKKKVLIKDSTMNGFESLRRFPSGQIQQQKILNSAYFVAMTTVIEQNLERAGIPSHKIFRIPNGVTVSNISYQRKDSHIVLFVGNLYQQPAKGIDILLKAWVEVIKEFPEAQLIVVGDGATKEYHEFVAQLGIAGSVKFEGRQNLPGNYYSSADLFVLPSRREGMSNALMEAMMNGMPCVATDISGNHDLIQSGENGLLVPPGNIAVLSLALKKMLSDPVKAEIMGRNAHKAIINLAGFDGITDRYISLYKALLNSN